MTSWSRSALGTQAKHTSARTALPPNRTTTTHSPLLLNLPNRTGWASAFLAESVRDTRLKVSRQPQQAVVAPRLQPLFLLKPHHGRTHTPSYLLALQALSLHLWDKPGVSKGGDILNSQPLCSPEGVHTARCNAAGSGFPPTSPRFQC